MDDQTEQLERRSFIWRRKSARGSTESWATPSLTGWNSDAIIQKHRCGGDLWKALIFSWEPTLTFFVDVWVIKERMWKEDHLYGDTKGETLNKWLEKRCNAIDGRDAERRHFLQKNHNFVRDLENIRVQLLWISKLRFVTCIRKNARRSTKPSLIWWKTDAM